MFLWRTKENYPLLSSNMSHVMRKPVYAICEQQRRRSACTSAKSDQYLCCSLPGEYNTSSCYSHNFKPVASFSCWPGQFESYLVGNPEDRFSRDEAHINLTYMRSYMYYSAKSIFLQVPWSCLSREGGKYTHLVISRRQVHADLSTDHLRCCQFPGEWFVRSWCWLRDDSPTTAVLVVKATFW